jgi:hypothetical protein
VFIRGSKPPLHSCSFVVHPPPHSCSFVVQKRPLHSYPFVVQNHPCIRVHSWFKTTPAFVSIRGSKHPHSWFPNRTTETSTTRSSPGLKSVVSKSSTAIGVSLSACPGIPALMSPDFNRLNPPVSVLLILWYCTPAEIPHRNRPPPADSTTTKTRATWKRLAGKVRTEEPWRL